jgi:hypothetical protein
MPAFFKYFWALEVGIIFSDLIDSTALLLGGAD